MSTGVPRVGRGATFKQASLLSPLVSQHSFQRWEVVDYALIFDLAVKVPRPPRVVWIVLQVSGSQFTFPPPWKILG